MRESMSPAEEREILDEIAAIGRQQRVSATEEAFSFTAGRNDRRLPLLINLAAAGLLILAGLALHYYFSRRESFITSSQAAFLTTEGMLLEAVRRDAQNKIGEREREIAEIQMKLNSLGREQEQLRLATDARMRQREQELQAAMSRTLEAERERLRSQGFSAQDMELRLRRLQDQIDNKNQQDLDALRRQVESERSQRETALKTLEAEFRGSLDRLDSEKRSLQEQLRSREQELRERLRRETALMQGELAKSAESLARLNELRQQEQQVSDQLLSFYELLRANLAEGDYEQALRTLAAFEFFLNREPSASLPAMQRRRPIEQFVIDSFRNHIDRQRSSNLQSTESLLTSLQQTVSQADQSSRAGRKQEARRLYLAALSWIPEVQRSHEVISRMDQEVWQEEKRVLEGRIEALQPGSVPEAQELARRQQQLQQELGDLKAQVAQRQKEYEQQERQLRASAVALQQELERVRREGAAQEAAFAQKRGRLLERLQALRSRYFELTARSVSPSGTPEQELTILLETRLLLKEILVSEPMRSRYPDLYEKTERFLEAFGETLQKEGQLAALRDLGAIIAALSSDQAGEVNAALLDGYAEDEFRDSFFRLLDTLRLLVP